jgi:hypothetical protein
MSEWQRTHILQDLCVEQLKSRKRQVPKGGRKRRPYKEVTMYRVMFLTLCLILLLPFTAMAGVSGSEPKELSGMSIVGNDEAPKSLYIVPWKSSELGVKTSLQMLFDEQLVPVDRDVFMRQLVFFAASRAQPATLQAGAAGAGPDR